MKNQHQLPAFVTPSLRKFFSIHELQVSVHGLTGFYRGVGTSLYVKCAIGKIQSMWMTTDRLKSFNALSVNLAIHIGNVLFKTRAIFDNDLTSSVANIKKTQIGWHFILQRILYNFYLPCSKPEESS